VTGIGTTFAFWVTLAQALAASSSAPLHLGRLLELDGGVLDVGLGDVTGDGRSDVVLLRTDAVELYELPEEGIELAVRYRLDHLPQERIRTRDPRGRMVVADFNRDGRAEIFFRVFHRRPGEVLAWTGADLCSIRRFEGVPLCVLRMAGRPLVLFGRAEPGTNLLGPAPQLCDINEPSGRPLDISSTFWDLRCHQPEGSEAPWMLWVDREARLHRGESDAPLEPELFSGMAMTPADVDGDGQPEYVLSEPAWPGEPDAVRVWYAPDRVWTASNGLTSLRAASVEQGRAGASRVMLLSCDGAPERCRVHLLER